MAENKATGSMGTRVEGQEFIAERVFSAPRELVFKAFSTEEALTKWWGPKDWTLPVCKIDFRPGGSWHYCMRSPDGQQDSWGMAFYREIVVPEKIVYEDNFSDAEGKLNAEMPSMLITMLFEDLGGKTRIVSRTKFAAATDIEAVLAMGMVEGLTETWDRLEAYVS